MVLIISQKKLNSVRGEDECELTVHLTRIAVWGDPGCLLIWLYLMGHVFMYALILFCMRVFFFG